MTRDLGQALLDAFLLAYVVQYASVALPGVLGALGRGTISATAVLLSAFLWAGAGSPRRIDSSPPDEQPWPVAARWSVLVIALFALGYVLGFVHTQHILPVMSNDALTYHFPAAVQWLQTGRLGVFPTWFFNPANTYSPLAGSTFIAWLIAPFGNDVLARFVELPALIAIGAALFQLCRQLGVEPVTAALTAAAAVVARPLFFPAIMGKDDLFVALFFPCALLAMTPRRAAEPFAALRLGLAIGLLLATKYTVFLALPILLLVSDGPWRSGRRWRWWAAVLATIVVVAGPWYWRNYWLTGNPLFPMDVSIRGRHLFRGLFTTGRSKGLRTIEGIAKVLIGGNYGLPTIVMMCVMAGWIALWVKMLSKSTASILRDPLTRAVTIGPALGLFLFLWRSPFPEVRFVLPTFLLLFAATAAACERIIHPPRVRQAIALLVLVLACWTTFANPQRAIEFGTIGFAVALLGFVPLWITRGWKARTRLLVLGGGAGLVAASATFVLWTSSVTAYKKSIFLPGAGWDLSYPEARPLWEFVAEHIPLDATVAYANLYMTYPLQGFDLGRRVVYAPARPGVRSPADLPRLGDRLSGEALVPAAIRATVESSDRATWLKNLRQTSAEYLVVGKVRDLHDAPEAVFADADPRRFRKLFENDGGIIYAIDRAAPD